MLVSAALAAHALQNRSQVDHKPGSPRTRVLRAVAEKDPSHSAVSEIQASTALPVGTTVSVRAYAAHGQAQHQTSFPVVEVPSNASLRDLFRYRTVDAPNGLFVWPSMVVVATKNDES